MKKEINNKLIRSFNPCYDPDEVGIPNRESLSIKGWIEKYRNVVKNKEDIIWLICHPEFMSDRDYRLFAVWCAREALKLIETPDSRSINACDVAERFANGQATSEELAAARDAAWDATRAATRYATRAAAWDATRYATRDAARDAAWAAARDAARDAAWAAARDVAWDAQIDHLLTYFL